MNILIIEDESLASDKLKATIASLDQEIKVVGTLVSVDDSIHWLQNNPEPDLILSDIHLADGLCFNIYATVKTQCPIIFTTAYEKYAIQAFEVNSIDYLLKPVTAERLQQALDKYKTISGAAKEDRTEMFATFKNMLTHSQKEYKTRFLCKLGNKIKSVPTESIQYFYSQDKMTFLVDQEGKRLPVNNTLDEIDQMLDPLQFFKLNRQFISSFRAIDEIHPYFKGRLKLKLNPNAESDIIVSTERTPIFKAWLDR